MTIGNQILEEAISKWREEIYLAFKRALEEQRTGEPCEDAISRQAVLKLFATHDGKYLFEAIRDLPSVTPKQTEITLESAIDYLHSIGWMQKHDKELTEGVEQEPMYCDRNICIKNEYNGIGCTECEVTKSRKPHESEGAENER